MNNAYKKILRRLNLLHVPVYSFNDSPYVLGMDNGMCPLPKSGCILLRDMAADHYDDVLCVAVNPQTLGFITVIASTPPLNDGFDHAPILNLQRTDPNPITEVRLGALCKLAGLGFRAATPQEFAHLNERATACVATFGLRPTPEACRMQMSAIAVVNQPVVEMIGQTEPHFKGQNTLEFALEGALTYKVRARFNDPELWVYSERSSMRLAVRMGVGQVGAGVPNTLPCAGCTIWGHPEVQAGLAQCGVATLIRRASGRIALEDFFLIPELIKEYEPF
jgi:hypothetical protein